MLRYTADSMFPSGRSGLVVTALDDASVIQNHDGLSCCGWSTDGAQITARSCLLHQVVHTLLYQCLGTGIDGAGCSSRIMAGGSATAARAMEISWRCPWERPRAASGQHGIVTVRQAVMKLSALASFAAAIHSLIRRVQTSVADVLHYGSGKQV